MNITLLYKMEAPNKYARQNKYYENNKEKILKKNNSKVECDVCKSIVNRSNLPRHQTSMKCLKHIFIEFENDSDNVTLLKDL